MFRFNDKLAVKIVLAFLAYNCCLPWLGLIIIFDTAQHLISRARLLAVFLFRN